MYQLYNPITVIVANGQKLNFDVQHDFGIPSTSEGFFPPHV